MQASRVHVRADARPIKLEMDALLIILAIPAFFLLIGIEALVARARGREVYRFQDAINSLSAGIGQQAFGLLMVGWVIGGYVVVHERFAVMSISPRSWVAWVILLFAVDLAYYLFHWASHRVNFIWATHVVHHQSEEYNLSTALRQSALQPAMSAVFYWPLAIVGFPPVMFITMSTINTLYQFWIHTRLVGRMGPLEWVLNTPSHHRVHHGIDPKYIDKNFAGIFIIWDRLFGTFQREEQEPVYGTVKPLASWNPLWANVEHWVRLASMARDTARWPDKLSVWVRPPEWRPKDLGGPVGIPEVDRAKQVKYETPRSAGLNAYVVVQFIVVAAAISLGLWIQDKAPLGYVALLVVWIAASVTSWGALYERKSWAQGLEAARLAAIAPLAFMLSRGTHWLIPSVLGMGVVVAGSAWWVLRPGGPGDPSRGELVGTRSSFASSRG